MVSIPLKVQLLFRHARVRNLIWRLECSLLVNVTLYLLAISLFASFEARCKLASISFSVLLALIAVLDVATYWKYIRIPIIIPISVLISLYINPVKLVLFRNQLWKMTELVGIISCCYLMLNIVFVLYYSMCDFVQNKRKPLKPINKKHLIRL